MIRFNWDEEKNKANLREHGVAFEDAQFVFSDPNYYTEPDGRYDYGEERWRTIGMAKSLLLLIVANTFRDEDDTEIIRIISARKAEPHERRLYDDRKL